jgi:selenophosphate synthase
MTSSTANNAPSPAKSAPKNVKRWQRNPLCRSRQRHPENIAVNVSETAIDAIVPEGQLLICD